MSTQHTITATPATKGRMTLGELAAFVDAARDAIRAEYMRSLPDAYNGSASVREQCWERLLATIDAYADARSTPTTTDVSATTPAPSRRKATNDRPQRR